MTDARFEDGREAPLNIGAFDTEDLLVIAALVQDAVFPTGEMVWDKTARRFALLVNRFRWEDDRAQRNAPERVQSMLLIDQVDAVATNGIDRGDKDTILSLMDIGFDEEVSPSGYILLTLAGDGAIRLKVEALEVTLKDVTKPYMAPSKQTPKHPE